MNNLEGEIQMYEKKGELDQLVPRLLHRGLFLGRIADRERALELADRWVRAEPKNAEAHLERAAARSGLHRFRDALADVAKAERLAGKSERSIAERAEILLATGDAQGALALRDELARVQPGILESGSVAVVVGELGRAEEADARLEEAIRQHRNPSPFPLVWVLFQRGLLWEREGQPARARGYYEAAVERLPGYAAATQHLATVLAAQGERGQAIALLRSLLETSDDPEVLSELARLLRAEGSSAQADELSARARARYHELLSRHPAAFAAHAARFYLGEGKDPARAVELAATNVEVRPVADAYQLMVEAQLATADARAACKTAERAMRLPARPKQLLAVLWRAFSACHDDRRAAEVDTLLDLPAPTSVPRR
jgi:tetratricopeptide (TPR) repeat protein